MNITQMPGFSYQAMAGMLLENLEKHYPLACKKLGYPVLKEKSLDELLQYDRVVLEQPMVKTLSSLFKRMKAMDCFENKFASEVPFLQEGVLVCPGEEGVTEYIYWVVEDDEVYTEIYQCGDQFTKGKLRLLMRMNIALKGEMRGRHIAYDSKAQVILDACKKGKLRLPEQQERYAREWVKTLGDDSEYLTVGFTGIMTAINGLLEYQSQTENTAKKPYSVVLRGNAKKGTKKRVVYLDAITVVPGADSKVKIHKGAVMNRYTDVWGVRGHERHYKSGKVIWIDAYEKGPERGKKKAPAKEYRIRGEAQS